MHLKMIAITWMCLRVLPGVSLATETLDKDLEEKMYRERAVLTAAVSVYTVKNASVEQALVNLWDLVLGHKPETLMFRSPQPGQPITLSLRNVTVSEVLDYIAEINGCRWEICGRHGDVQELVFIPLQLDHRYEFLVTEAFILNGHGRAALGVEAADDRLLDLKAVLNSYGVEFGDERKNPRAVYSATKHCLVITAPEAGVSFAKAIVKLANNGKLKPASKE